MVLAAFSFAVPVSSRSNLTAAPCALRRSSFLPAAKPTAFTTNYDRFFSVRRSTWMLPKAINVSPIPPGGDPVKVSPIPPTSPPKPDPAMNGSVTQQAADKFSVDLHQAQKFAPPKTGSPTTSQQGPRVTAAGGDDLFSVSSTQAQNYAPGTNAVTTEQAPRVTVAGGDDLFSVSSTQAQSYVPGTSQQAPAVTVTGDDLFSIDHNQAQSYAPGKNVATSQPAPSVTATGNESFSVSGATPQKAAPLTTTADKISVSLVQAKPAPAPIVPAAPSGEVATLSGPPGVFNAAVALGTTKANKSITAIILMGIAAGAYIAIGCLMSLAITGNSPGLNMANPGLSKFIFGFVGQPWGLFMVLTTGAELFTGNSMLMTTAALRGKTNWPTVIAKWLLVFVANCVGALAVVWFALKSQAVSAGAAAYVAALASAKVAVPWEVAFLRGIGCNWIVCVGVLAATGSRDLVGKFMAALAVVSMFVTLGFDQCIANMFFLPLGLACGGDLTVKSLIMSNIIPVTLGNIVGGALLVGMVYHVVNGGKKAAAK